MEVVCGDRGVWREVMCGGGVIFFWDPDERMAPANTIRPTTYLVTGGGFQREK